MISKVMPGHLVLERSLKAPALRVGDDIFLGVNSINDGVVKLNLYVSDLSERFILENNKYIKMEKNPESGVLSVYLNKNDSLLLSENKEVQVLNFNNGKKIKIGISAPKEVRVLRSELEDSYSAFRRSFLSVVRLKKKNILL